MEDRIAHFVIQPLHLLGLLFLIVAGISMCTGKTPTRGCLVSRAEEPGTFWWLVAVWFLAGIIFVGFLS
jgi:uncharacterized membrane protein